MYRQAIAWSVGLGLYALQASPQVSLSALTPDQLVEAAVEGNGDLLSSKQRVRQAQGLLKQAGVGIADNLEVGGLAGQPVGNTGEDAVSVTYAHTFETFGKRGKRVAVARREVALAEAEFDDRRRTLSLEVRTRYAGAVAERRKLEVIDRLLAVNREYLRLTEARVQKGDAAPLEAALLRVELNRDQARRALTEGQLRAVVLELKTALDIPAAEALTLSASLIPPSFVDDLPRLEAHGFANRPDLTTLRIAEERSAAQTNLANVETTPNVTLSGQYSHTDSAFALYGLTPAGALAPIRDHDNSIGLGVSIPLTTARRNRGNIEAAVARQSEFTLRRKYLERNIPTQIEAAYRRWQAAREAAAVFSGGLIEQSEKNLAVMRQAYTLGELRLIDILNEQRRVLDTELSSIDAEADLFRSYAELAHAVGGSLQ